MKIYQAEFDFPVVTGHHDLRTYFCGQVAARLGPDEAPVRFAVTRTDRQSYHCEIGVLAGWSELPGSDPPPLFEFAPRAPEDAGTFNVALLVPTGIGCEIGGHAGDAGPIARLLASVCDRLITHPNVVNASDINELPANGLYVEGSILCRLLQGTVGLRPVRANRVLCVMDAHADVFFEEAVTNAVNAARASYGLRCPNIVALDPPVLLKARYTSSGMAAGQVDGFERLLALVRRECGNFDAVALTGVVDVPPSYRADYFGGGAETVNPWGGIEAIYTHALSLLFPVPSAHAPMLPSKEIAAFPPGVVDPRMAAEAVSFTYLQCVLKGLQRSPRIFPLEARSPPPDVLTAANVSCLVVPVGALGLPVLAALEQGIPVVAVRENRNVLRNDLAALPWPSGQYIEVETYLEAVGVLCALKAGLSLEAVRRPLRPAPVMTYPSRTGAGRYPASGADGALSSSDSRADRAPAGVETLSN
ncbi:MAG: DUF3326 domain-containing protein [Armatimonadetes bacterium]|nr:DUF3326 domain-containing protein [Armatimonadota bacterium]